LIAREKNCLVTAIKCTLQQANNVSSLLVYFRILLALIPLTNVFVGDIFGEDESTAQG